MAAKHRKPKQKLDHKAKIAKAVLAGNNYSEIAASLGVSLRTVHRDLSEVLTEWRENAISDIDQLQAIELARLDKVEAEAWKAWERSIGTTKKTRKGITAQGEVDLEILEEINGDPRYLEKVLVCVQKRIAIFGLEKPIKVDLKNEYTGLTRSEIIKEIARLEAGTTTKKSKK